MTPDLQRLTEIEETLKLATVGNWIWTLNQNAKSVSLQSDCRGKLVVMDFDRWGMAGATPRFRDASCLMRKAVEFATVVPGREHHKDWFKAVTHPDAKLIANARVWLEALTQEVRELWATIGQEGPLG